MSFAMMFDPENGLQLYDTETGDVADLAVLEGTWRPAGDATPGESEVDGHTHQRFVSRGVVSDKSSEFAVPVTTFGQLRIRSAAAAIYCINSAHVGAFNPLAK